MGKQSQLLLKSTEVELGLQVGVEFDKNDMKMHEASKHITSKKSELDDKNFCVVISFQVIILICCLIIQ